MTWNLIPLTDFPRRRVPLQDKEAIKFIMYCLIFQLLSCRFFSSLHYVGVLSSASLLDCRWGLAYWPWLERIRLYVHTAWYSFRWKSSTNFCLFLYQKMIGEEERANLHTPLLFFLPRRGPHSLTAPLISFLALSCMCSVDHACFHHAENSLTRVNYILIVLDGTATRQASRPGRFLTTALKNNLRISEVLLSFPLVFN